MGQFLSEKHTVQTFRSQFWLPSLVNRQRVHDRERAGRPSLGDRVKSRTTHLLDTHQSELLPPGVADELRDVVSRAEAREAAKPGE